jgi:dethiobiotin synthetase
MADLKDTVILQNTEMSAEELAQQLREVRSLIVRLIAVEGAGSLYSGLELSNALYTIEYLTEKVNLKDA